MKKKFCRKVINYEYFTYDGIEKAKLLKWVKSFNSNSELCFMGNQWWISLPDDFCSKLPEYPCLILHPIGCNELLFVDPKCLGKDYEILSTDYFDED